jgi:hypothetical protein
MSARHLRNIIHVSGVRSLHEPSGIMQEVHGFVILCIGAGTSFFLQILAQLMKNRHVDCFSRALRGTRLIYQHVKVVLEPYMWEDLEEQLASGWVREMMLMSFSLISGFLITWSCLPCLKQSSHWSLYLAIVNLKSEEQQRDYNYKALKFTEVKWSSKSPIKKPLDRNTCSGTFVKKAIG